MQERRKGDRSLEESRETICAWTAVTDTEAIVAYLDYVRMEHRNGRRTHLMSPKTWFIRRFQHVATSRNHTRAAKASKGSPSRWYYLRINLDTGSLSAMTTRAHYDNDVWTRRVRPGYADDEAIIDGYLDYLVGSWCEEAYLMPLSYWRDDMWQIRHINRERWRQEFAVSDEDDELERVD